MTSKPNYTLIQEVTLNKFLSEVTEHLAQGYTLTEETRYVPGTGSNTIPLFCVKMLCPTDVPTLCSLVAVSATKISLMSDFMDSIGGRVATAKVRNDFELASALVQLSLKHTAAMNELHNGDYYALVDRMTELTDAIPKVEKLLADRQENGGAE